MSEILQFRPVCDSAVERWSKPQRFDFLHRLPAAPIADTELLHLSHYCPTVIRLYEDGPRVLILLDPALVQPALVDQNGRWRPPYAPIALRSLPFWPGAGPSEVEVATDLVATERESFALRDAAGRPSEQFTAVTAWIGRLQQGMRRLSEAAKLIIAADLLAPLTINQPGALTPLETEYLTVCAKKLYALAPTRVAALSCDSCLPLHLVTACLYSRRLLARHVRVEKSSVGDFGVNGRNCKELELDLVQPLDLDLKLDKSPLFSFEHFARHIVS